MPLTIRLHTPTAIPLEVDSITMQAVREQSAEEVAQTLVYRGNQQLPLGEFFSVSGSAQEDQTIVWEGDCSKVKLIGAKLTGGTVRVEGNVGMHLGAEMTAGEIYVSGNASDWVGAEMKGGRITVIGNAGHLVGSVYRGGRKGMTGGEILIHGHAGNEIGHTLRRGLIAVGGNVGDIAGVGMIAGTIIVMGEPGIRHGAGMKRGTIALLGHQSPELLPTFKFAGEFRPTFLELYLRHLQSAGFPVQDGCISSNMRRYTGDFLELGKGEIIARSC